MVMSKEKERFKHLLEMLPEGWEAKAKELGALQRAREIKTPEALLWLNLLYLTEGKSMATTSAISNLWPCEDEQRSSMQTDTTLTSVAAMDGYPYLLQCRIAY